MAVPTSAQVGRQVTLIPDFVGGTPSPQITSAQAGRAVTYVTDTDTQTPSPTITSSQVGRLVTYITDLVTGTPSPTITSGQVGRTVTYTTDLPLSSPVPTIISGQVGRVVTYIPAPSASTGVFFLNSTNSTYYMLNVTGATGDEVISVSALGSAPAGGVTGICLFDSQSNAFYSIQVQGAGAVLTIVSSSSTTVTPLIVFNPTNGLNYGVFIGGSLGQEFIFVEPL